MRQVPQETSLKREIAARDESKSFFRNSWLPDDTPRDVHDKRCKDLLKLWKSLGSSGSSATPPVNSGSKILSLAKCHPAHSSQQYPEFLAATSGIIKVANRTKSAAIYGLWTCKNSEGELCVHKDLEDLLDQDKWRKHPHEKWALDRLARLARTWDDMAIVSMKAMIGQESDKSLVKDLGDMSVQLVTMLDGIRFRFVPNIEEEIVLHSLFSQIASFLMGLSLTGSYRITDPASIAGIAARISWTRLPRWNPEEGCYMTNDAPCTPKVIHIRQDPQYDLLVSLSIATTQPSVPSSLDMWLQLLPLVQPNSIVVVLKTILAVLGKCDSEAIKVAVQTSVTGEQAIKAVGLLLHAVRAYPVQYPHLAILHLPTLISSKSWTSFRTKDDRSPLEGKDYGPCWPGKQHREGAVFVVGYGVMGFAAMDVSNEILKDVAFVESVSKINIKQNADCLQLSVTSKTVASCVFDVHAQWPELKAALKRYGFLYQTNVK